MGRSKDRRGREIFDGYLTWWWKWSVTLERLVRAARNNEFQSIKKWKRHRNSIRRHEFIEEEQFHFRRTSQTSNKSPLFVLQTRQPTNAGRVSPEGAQSALAGAQRAGEHCARIGVHARFQQHRLDPLLVGRPHVMWRQGNTVAHRLVMSVDGWVQGHCRRVGRVVLTAGRELVGEHEARRNDGFLMIVIISTARKISFWLHYVFEKKYTLLLQSTV